MLNAKGISVLLAIALSGSSFAATPAEFKFPTKKLVKDDGSSFVKSNQECDLFCQYGLQVSHGVIGFTTFVVGYVLAYQIHAARARVLDDGIPKVSGGPALDAVAAVVDEVVVGSGGGKAKRGRSRTPRARK